MDLDVMDVFAEPEVGQIRALVSDVEAAIAHPALSEGMLVELTAGEDTRPAGRWRSGILAWDPDGRLCAYAQLSGASPSFSLELVLREVGEASRDLTAQVLQAALDRAAAAGGGTVHLVAPKPEKAFEDVVAALGFKLERRVIQMRRRLPLDPPDDVATVATRPFAVGADELSWLEVNNRAFAGHPEQGAWDLAAIRARERLDWFDPGGFLLHEVDKRLAAFCWTKVHPPRAPGVGGAGEIYVIGVDPDFQGRGLGRALTVAGAAHLAGAGAEYIVLYVDDINTPALALYGALGFGADHEDHAYAAVVAPR